MMLSMLAETKNRKFGDQKQVYVKDGAAKIQSVRSEENMVDPFKNNLITGPFESLTSRYVHR